MTFSTLNNPTQLSPADADQIRGTAKWARFLAIVGFIMLGLMVVFGAFMGSFLGKIMAMQSQMTGNAMPFDTSMLGTIYLVIFLISAVIYFFPTLFLYQYASRTLKALRGPFDADSFSSALQAHRSFYGYIGVLMIVVLCLYVMGGVGMAIAFAAMGHLPQAHGATM